MNKSIRKTVSMFFFAGVVVLAGMADVRTQTVWLVCTWDTSSIWKDQSGRQKFERRFYVSPLVSMSKESFLRVDGTGNRIEGLCGDYLDKTVVKAATDRGERLDPGGQLKIIRNIELSGENLGSPNPYNFAPKEKIEKLRDDASSEMKDANRIIFSFNWDPTGKNEQADADNEVKRTSPTIGPTPSKPGRP